MKRLLQRIPGAHLAAGAAPTASPEKAGGGSISSPPPHHYTPCRSRSSGLLSSQPLEQLLWFL
jgi:hypothetical protein